MNALFLTELLSRDIYYWISFLSCVFLMYKIYKWININHHIDKNEQRRLNERLMATGTTEKCSYCQKSFQVPSMEKSWDKKNLIDVMYCSEKHYVLERKFVFQEQEIKWLKEHTMTCAWCERKYVSADKYHYCSNERCQSERRIHKELLKGK